VRHTLVLALLVVSVAFCYAGGPDDMPFGILANRVSVLDGRTDAHDVAIASHASTIATHGLNIASHVLDLASANGKISSHTIDIAARALLGGNPAQSFAALNLTASGVLRVASDAAFLTNTPASTAWYPKE